MVRPSARFFGASDRRVTRQLEVAAPLLERRSTFWAVALLTAVLFAVTNLPWHLDDYDQAKQAFTSFEMVNDGQWLYQHTPSGKVATKPPLIGWVSAAVYAATRSWDAAWRLPSLAAAALLLYALTRTATASYGIAAGVVALCAFGLNLLSPRLATLVRTDMPLALVVFLLGANIWRKVQSGDAWTARDRLIVFVLLTTAMLVKGPIVYAFLLPGLVVFQLIGRANGVRASPWSGWWPWVASLAVFLAWAAAGIAWVPEFYEQVVLKEFAGRFGETVHRPQPLLFYFPHLLHKFAPWSVLLIALAAVGWRREKIGFAARWRRISPATRWLICWSAGGLLVMSLIPSKRVDRIFPIIPPLCLLLAAQVGNAWRDETLGPRVRRWSAVAVVFAAVFTTGYAAQRMIISYRADEGAFARFGTLVRHDAAERGWRYEVVQGKHEGLLLYLQRTRFIKLDEAMERWNSGTLDAVVVPAEQAQVFQGQVSGAEASPLAGAITQNGRVRRYVLLVKSPAATAPQ